MKLIKTPELIKEPIRALWWKQPYGTLMLHDKIETRVWDTGYRGLVLICTSKNPYSYREVYNISGKHTESILEKLKLGYLSNERLRNPKIFPAGQAIAVGRLVNSYSMRWHADELCFVNFNSALYEHLYEDVTPIKPFPLKGQQGWKKLDSGIWSQIEFV